MSPQFRVFESRSAAATRALGRALAARVDAPILIRLEGQLGAGKTTFAQGIAEGLGIAAQVVSPSYTLVREYAPGHRADRLGPGLVHMDFYRLSGSEEAIDLGLADYLAGDDLLLIEWPERARSVLPARGLRVRFHPIATDAVDPADPVEPPPDAERRELVLEALDPQARQLLTALEIRVDGIRELASRDHGIRNGELHA